MSRRVEDPAETSTRRKRIVELLDDLDTPVTVDQLVDELDSMPGQRPVGPDETAWERRHEQLHDEDLPALDRAGLLVFDDERGLVTSQGEEFPSRADAAPTQSADADGADAGGQPFPRYFVGLSVVSLGVLAATVSNLGPFASAPDVAVSTALVLGFSLLSLVTALRQ